MQLGWGILRTNALFVFILTISINELFFKNHFFRKLSHFSMIGSNLKMSLKTINYSPYLAL